MSNYIKPKNQSEKSMDGDKGKPLSPAGYTVEKLGGVWLATGGGLVVAFDGMLELEYAGYTSSMLGGIRMGDGLMAYSVDGVQKTGVYIGDGLTFTPNADGSDPRTDPDVKGRKISVAVGNGLEFDDEGRLTATGGGGGTAGDGIVIDNNVVSVNIGNGLEFEETEGAPDGETRRLVPKIDNETITLNDKGELEASGGIQYGIIIQEKDVEYLLHEYTEVGYIAGNKICYGGPQNQIILQGYVVYKDGGTAPNGASIDTNSNYKYLTQIPDVPVYSSISLVNAKADETAELTISSLLMNLKQQSTTRSTYEIKQTYTNETSEVLRSSVTSYDPENVGIALVWEELYAPGSSDLQGFEYGYADCIIYAKYKGSSAERGYIFTNIGNCIVPFGSIAEYHAAVALTYEPVELTQINETITEV